MSTTIKTMSSSSLPVWIWFSILLVLTLLSLSTSSTKASASSAAGGAPINFNLKSKTLSHALSKNTRQSNKADDLNDTTTNNHATSGGTSSSVSSDATGATGGGGISLDLSGNIKCCLFGKTIMPSSSSNIPHHRVQGSKTKIKIPTTTSASVDTSSSRATVIPLIHHQHHQQQSTNKDGEIKSSSSASSISNSPWIPSLVLLGANYDFKKIWYGATRLSTTFSWKQQNDQQSSSSNRVSTVSTSSLATTNVSFEKGLRNPQDYSTELQIIFPKRRQRQQQRRRKQRQRRRQQKQTFMNLWNANDDVTSPSKLSIRFDTGHHHQTTSATSSSQTQFIPNKPSTTLEGRTSIHPRIDIVTKTTMELSPMSNTNHNDDNDVFNLSSRIPPETTNWSEGSWLPDVTMTPGGRLISKSSLGFKSKTHSTQYETSGEGEGGRGGRLLFHRTGIRLMASRQLNWNVLGLSPSSNNDGDDDTEEEDDRTIVRLEISGLSGGGKSYSSITWEAALERIRESSKVTLLHEWIVQRMN